MHLRPPEERREELARRLGGTRPEIRPAVESEIRGLDAIKQKKLEQITACIRDANRTLKPENRIKAAIPVGSFSRGNINPTDLDIILVLGPEAETTKTEKVHMALYGRLGIPIHVIPIQFFHERQFEKELYHGFLKGAFFRYAQGNGETANGIRFKKSGEKVVSTEPEYPYETAIWHRDVIGFDPKISIQVGRIARHVQERHSRENRPNLAKIPARLRGFLSRIRGKKK